MGKINVARVILGGLLAGLVMNVSEYVLNIYVVADEANAVYQRLGVQPPGMHQIAIFLIMGFVLGIIMIFVYAAMRPRFGAGAKTAIIAGVVTWIVSMFGPVADVVMGITPPSMLGLPGIWSLVEMAVAGVIGAWVYKESA